MRVLRRRVAAMSPREKQIAIFSLLGVITLALYCSPFFLFTTLALVACFILCYSFPAWLGLNPRAGLKEPGVLGRWLLGLGVTGVSVPTRRRTKTSDNNRNERREAERNFVPSHREDGIYRGEALSSDSFLFSPRDFLMGSYIGKPESPSSEFVRPRVVRNPREQLRDKLSRPNHAVCTPNRRLSFAGYVCNQITLLKNVRRWEALTVSQRMLSKKFKVPTSWRVLTIGSQAFQSVVFVKSEPKAVAVL